MKDSQFPRVRYVLGNCARIVSRPWRQQSIPPGIATTIFASSFNDSGWHHIRQTLLELDLNPRLRASNSTLGRFLRDFCPTSITKLAGVENEEPLPLFVYPWGTFTSGASNTSKIALTSRFCGPSREQFIADEFERTVALYKQMLVTGYTPLKFPNSYITGTWLEALNGARRFVVMQGNHRMAVLAHIGISQVAVRTSKAALPRVRESELQSWPLVVSGRCSINHARRVFHYFFEQNGWHVAASLGLKDGQ